jgi:cell division protein FtsL
MSDLIDNQILLPDLQQQIPQHIQQHIQHQIPQRQLHRNTEEDEVPMILNNQQSKNKSFYRVALYIALVCCLLIVIIIVILIMRKTETKEEILNKRLEQREKELLEAKHIIGELTSERKEREKIKQLPKNTSTSLDIPTFDVNVPEDIEEKRPRKTENERSKLVKQMNQPRETVSDILAKKETPENDDDDKEGELDKIIYSGGLKDSNEND